MPLDRPLVLQAYSEEKKAAPGGLLLLYFLDGIPFHNPIGPSSLESVDLRESRLHQLPRHPDAGIFVVSGAIQDNGLALVQFRHPLPGPVECSPNAVLDHPLAFIPIPFPPDVDDFDIRRIKQGQQLLCLHARHVICGSCRSNKSHRNASNGQQQADHKHPYVYTSHGLLHG